MLCLGSISTEKEGAERQEGSMVKEYLHFSTKFMLAIILSSSGTMSVPQISEKARFES